MQRISKNIKREIKKETEQIRKTIKQKSQLRLCEWL